MKSVFVLSLTICWLGLSGLAFAIVAADSIPVSRVIKVTPTLVYLDIAAQNGIVIGDRFSQVGQLGGGLLRC